MKRTCKNLNTHRRGTGDTKTPERARLIKPLVLARQWQPERFHIPKFIARFINKGKIVNMKPPC